MGVRRDDLKAEELGVMSPSVYRRRLSGVFLSGVVVSGVGLRFLLALAGAAAAIERCRNFFTPTAVASSSRGPRAKSWAERMSPTRGGT
jgi:hypothetical protein